MTATTDIGSSLATAWQVGFVGGPAAERTVLDASGAVVARDGDVLEIPDAAWPSLHGYFVCPSHPASPRTPMSKTTVATE